MSNPFEDFYVKLAGERSVVTWLEDKGFIIGKWDTSAPGTEDIEARSGSTRLFVQVRTSVHPEDPPSLTSGEEEDIKSRASMHGSAEVWEARVQLDSHLELVGKIKWRKLFEAI